jgi:hypothetical protein
MLSDQDIELARPEAFDFAFGNLPAAKRAEFNRHLVGCPHCQAVVDEYADIGAIMKRLPPHVAPSADLEDRTVASMVAVLAGQRAERNGRSAEADPGSATRLYPQEAGLPGPGDPGEPGEAAGIAGPGEPSGPPSVTRLPIWRRYGVRIAAITAAAAAVIVAAVISISGGHGAVAPAAVAIPLHVTTAGKASGFGAASGRATARQDASGSWTISLTVTHLKSFGDSQWYGCWYLSRDHQQVASAGTFQVAGAKSVTFSMTSAVDPHDFRTMEITVGPPDKTGALAGTVILTGQVQ